MAPSTPSSSPPTTPISISRTTLASAGGQQLLGDPEVLVERHRRAVPHVGLEQRLLATRHPLDRQLEQRADEAVELVLGAVVGVQRDGDGVVLRDLAGVRRERHRAGDHVLDVGAGQVLRAARGDLDDPVGAGLREPLQRGVEGLGGRDVDGREREVPLRAASSISAYFWWVAIGMRETLVRIGTFSRSVAGATDAGATSPSRARRPRRSGPRAGGPTRASRSRPRPRR